jgi:hypothetical protein
MELPLEDLAGGAQQGCALHAGVAAAAAHVDFDGNAALWMQDVDHALAG